MRRNSVTDNHPKGAVCRDRKLEPVRRVLRIERNAPLQRIEKVHARLECRASFFRANRLLAMEQEVPLVENRLDVGSEPLPELALPLVVLKPFSERPARGQSEIASSLRCA